MLPIILGGNVMPSIGWLVVILILSLVGTIVAIGLFMPVKRRGEFTGFKAALYDFLNFNTFWITTLLKFLYIFLSIATVLYALVFCFTAGGVGGFFLTWGSALAALFVLRLVFEGIYVIISIRDQTVQLNDTMRRAFGSDTKNNTNVPNPASRNDAYRREPAPAPAPAPAVTPREQEPHCPGCGERVDLSKPFCTRCGRRLS